MAGKLRLGLFFGGRSTEHEVSVITGIQAYENLNKSKYELTPIYISKAGEFFTNPKFWDLKNYQDVDGLLLSSAKITIGVKNGQPGFFTQGLISKFTPLDLAFPLLHGSFGEDGCLQGLFETNLLPYSGFNVLGSAVGMDKLTSKYVFQFLDLPIGKFTAVKRSDWQENSKKCLAEIKDNLKWPLFIKPGTIGSSIGVNRAKNEDELSFAIEVASVYSEVIIIEEAFENVIEVNCSALGYKEPEASVCEQPKPSGKTLSFADKYQNGGSKGGKSAGMASLDRIIPAPISAALTKKIQDTTVQIFKAFNGCGVARVDFFVDPKVEKIWVNEINTLPGSLSFYLWKPTGLEYPELLDKLIEAALERAQEQKKTQYTFESGLLSDMAKAGGLKG